MLQGASALQTHEYDPFLLGAVGERIRGPSCTVREWEQTHNAQTAIYACVRTGAVGRKGISGIGRGSDRESEPAIGAATRPDAVS